MTKTKSTKRALLMSALALITCVSMLIGSTFAWFTDSVTSGNNIIKSGNLDVELEYKKVVDGAATEWATVKDKTDIFNPNALWEPGHVEVVYLRVSNLGSLELKYQLGVNVIKETLGKTETGADIKLSDHLVFKAVEITEDQVGTYTRESAKTAAGTEKGLKDYNGDTTRLEVGGKDYVALLVYMPETVGNEANYRGTDIPTIELGINLYATQYTAEEDSFDEFYDKNAWVKGFKVYSANELQAAINAGETDIALMDNIDTTEAIVIPEGKTVALNLGGKTISAANSYAIENKGDLTVSGEGTISGLGVIRSTAGKLTINGGSYFGSSNYTQGSYQHTLKAENTVVEINGGTFDATVNGQNNAVINVSNGTTMTINGGTFKNVSGSLSNFDPYLFHYEGNGKLIINNGDFYGGWRFASNDASTDIYGGTFALTTDGQSFQAGNTHTLNVYGGTFTFGKDTTKTAVLAKVATGFEAVDNGDGTYTVLPGVGIERIADGLYKDSEGTHYVTNANGLSHLNTIISQNVKAVKLMADIDMTNKAWTMVGMHADAQGKLASFDGNGHTISNFVINGEAMFSSIASVASEVTFADLTFENVTINSTKSNTAIIVKQTYKDLVLDNVDVKGAKISGETKVATLVGTVFNEKSSTVTLTVKDCDISNVEITGNPDADSEERLAGLVAWVADKYSNEAIVLENNTMTNVAINSNSTASEHHALIYISDKSASNRYGVYHNEDAGVTLTDCTYMRKVADGYYVDLAGDCYIYNANGLMAFHDEISAIYACEKVAGKTINIMADIDATGKTWTTLVMNSGANNSKGFTFNGNGHTISNLTIQGKTNEGTGLFTMNSGSAENPTTFNDLTIDNAVVNGVDYHTGTIWGQVTGNGHIVLDKVSVINSKVSGGCNVGGLIGRNSESHATFTFADCSVKNTVVEATKKGDNAGASAFLGMALHIGNNCSANVVFEGTNVAEGNTLTTATGMQGGGIYTIATWGETTWDTPTVVSNFTNYSSK